MTRILLDTSAYSGFMRGVEEIAELVRGASEIVLTPVVLAELSAGFIGGARRKKNEAELLRFRGSSRVSVVAVDEETARRYAMIFLSLRRQGQPIPTNDLWIAASAMQHGLRVVTTDAHFLKVQQILVHHVLVR